jgi:peptidoglycan/LPS O-acetylase OafA/YrhL
MPASGSAALYEAISRRTIAGLDGIRAIAVLSVVVHHAGWMRLNGSQGVLLFFTLSGFLITHLLLGEEEISLKRFYGRRALRLFPAFYAYWVAVVLYLLATHREVPWGSAISAFFYVGNYHNAFNGHPATFVSHCWSLAVEEQFYLLWPFALISIGREPKRLIRVLIGVILAAWVYRTVIYFAGASGAYIYNAFECRIDHLLVGCLGAVVLRARAFPRLTEVVASSGGLALGVTVFFIVIGWYQVELGDGFLWVVAHAIEPPMVLCVLIYVMANAQRASVRWLEWAPLRHVGKVSYGIYLFHQMIHSPVRSKTAFLPVPLQYVAVVIVCVAVATLSYNLYEKPFLKLKDRLRSEPKTAVAKPA